MSKYTDLKQKIVKLLMKYEIVNFSFDEAKKFKSGIRAPIYCDFRKCLAYHDLMELLEEAFCFLIADSPNMIIAGVATGALPHASFVARKMGLPMCYVRPGATAKEYGLKKLIEGATVKGKPVRLIEDLVSTGDSILGDAQILLQEGAASVEAFSIFSYDFKQSKRAFKSAKLELTSILTIHDMLPLFKEELPPSQYDIVTKWVKNPEQWTKNYLATHPQS